MPDNGFKNVRTTASDAKVKLHFVRELTYFVERGLEKFGHPSSGVRLAAVVNAIRASLADSMVHGFAEKLSETELRTRLVTAYLDEYQADCRLYLKEQVAPVPVSRWDEEMALITARYGEHMPYGADAPPSLDGALAVAWLNVRRAQQRWMAWMGLGAMFWQTPEGRNRNGREVVDFEAVSKALRQELRSMEKRMLMFSLIKGGEAAEKARAWLLTTTLCEGMSVMEYLELDGVLPNSWRTDDDVALRASIRGEG